MTAALPGHGVIGLLDLARDYSAKDGPAEDAGESAQLNRAGSPRGR
jgi:hypothetical protein